MKQNKGLIFAVFFFAIVAIIEVVLLNAVIAENTKVKAENGVLMYLVRQDQICK